MVTTQTNNINDFHTHCHHPFYLAFLSLYDLCAEYFPEVHKRVAYSGMRISKKIGKMLRHDQVY
jgi:hypothetical protein